MLKVENLHVHLNTPAGVVKAVDGITFNIQPGETVGIVGESGSGKSVLAHSLIRLNPEPPAVYPDGEIYFEDRSVLHMNKKELQTFRGKEIAMIFQDPMSSLNPVIRIGRQLTEAILAHRKISKSEAKKKAIELLNDVGIPDPAVRMRSYPHQFSGGMRQRVLIAMALASEPKLLIADEPTTALDVTIQAQVLDLLKSIQQKYGTAIMIITHDMGVVARLADRIMVMYAGKIVESGKAEDIFYHTSMPYTWSLLRSMPVLGSTRHRLISIEGQPPDLINPPKGCAFQPRCPFAMEDCAHSQPALEPRSEAHHLAACLLSESAFEEKKNQMKGVLSS
ncbi:ABC transporter ATP-binding protein [Jeotgalibacillus haloalkalitolerans]|uniref:ABC transporter ATP-binding protein n=1 Tax=Jeotgalibacillus haloalkalitolerans TaxID=3104292 RepID=A0ABU5KPY7_9BACL|nr:ABC transporter ATP-binding protein [Jeotgalibacillus sp. HH7-29]MDZ5712770.1 ABC transporter ATP-binding protein [Jeotgalibacillus sp. HH7-29]